jgi:hypothetical protein
MFGFVGLDLRQHVESGRRPFLHLRCQLKSNNWNKFYEMVLAEYAAGY